MGRVHDPSTVHRSDQAVGPSKARRPAKRIGAWLGPIVLLGALVTLSTMRVGGAPAASGAADPSLANGTAVDGVGVGRPAPDFVGAKGTEPLLVDLDGHPIRLHDFAGRPLWIVFWATWCTPCQQEAGDIRALYDAHRDDGLAVLAIDIQEPAAAVREYALSHDLDYPIGLDPRAEVRALYGGWALPSHFFLDGDGTIRDRYLGQMTRQLMEEHLRAIIGS